MGQPTPAQQAIGHIAYLGVRLDNTSYSPFDTRGLQQVRLADWFDENQFPCTGAEEEEEEHAGILDII